jgi:hypothetical protein
MAGKGPPPKTSRRRANAPERGDWVPTEGTGWQHGPKVPPMPAGLMPRSRKAWRTWFRSWFASHWTPADLPALEQVIRLYDQVERGEYQRATELRMMMDTYGITPKGQQDRRWKPPEAAPAPAPKPQHYGHLKAVT